METTNHIDQIEAINERLLVLDKEVDKMREWELVCKVVYKNVPMA